MVRDAPTLCTHPLARAQRSSHVRLGILDGRHAGSTVARAAIGFGLAPAGGDSPGRRLETGGIRGQKSGHIRGPLGKPPHCQEMNWARSTWNDETRLRRCGRAGSERASLLERADAVHPTRSPRRRLRVGRCRAPTSEGSKQRARGWLVRRRARPAGLAAGDPGVIDQGGRHIAGERAGRQAPSGECVAMENSTRGFPLDNASPGLCHRPRLLLLCTTTTIHNPLARRRRCVCWPLDVDGGGERSRA